MKVTTDQFEDIRFNPNIVIDEKDSFVDSTTFIKSLYSNGNCIAEMTISNNGCECYVYDERLVAEAE